MAANTKWLPFKKKIDRAGNILEVGREEGNGGKEREKKGEKEREKKGEKEGGREERERKRKDRKRRERGMEGMKIYLSRGG